jgi:hypothetical protein
MEKRVPRITDCNESLYDLNKHLSFEANFYIDKYAALVFSGRVIDSQDVVILKNGDLREYSEPILKTYQQWNPIDKFQEFKNDFETQDVSSESIYFAGLMHEVVLEIKGPIADPEVYGVIVHMSKFILMDAYYPKDTGTISVSLLCKKQDISQMLEDLQSDLLDCLTVRQKMGGQHESNLIL